MNLQMVAFLVFRIESYNWEEFLIQANVYANLITLKLIKMIFYVLNVHILVKNAMGSNKIVHNVIRHKIYIDSL
jgi:hypothetical protein